VLDTLAARPDIAADLHRIGAVALSLRGYYGMRAAAAEARLQALVTVSGVTTLPWHALPTGVIQRTGDQDAARAFAGTIDAVTLARTLLTPLLVVAGGQDLIPTPHQAGAVATAAPQGLLHLVEGGDHLLANRQWLWIATATDWFTDQLEGTRLGGV
jgi:hypothetical protein